MNQPCFIECFFLKIYLSTNQKNNYFFDLLYNENIEKQSLILFERQSNPLLCYFQVQKIRLFLLRKNY